MVSNHQVQIQIVFNHSAHSANDDGSVNDYTLPGVDVEETVDVEEAMDMDEAMDVDEATDVDKAMDIEELMGHIDPYHQVVLHLTEDMLDTVGIIEDLLE